MGYPDEVYMTLASNSEMVPFVSVLQHQADSPYDQIQVISKLTNFYNFTLLPPVKPENITPDCRLVIGMNRIIYNKMKFIENKIYRLRIKQREKMIKLLNTIIEFLQKWPPTQDNMIISVQEEKLKAYLVQDTDKIKTLLAKHSFFLSLINPVLKSLPNKKAIQDELKIVIECISVSIDPRTSFYTLHGLQTKFESLYLSPLFPFAEEFNTLLLDYPPIDSQLFLRSLFTIVSSTLDALNINKKPYDSTLVLLLVRLTFDRIYEMNELLTTDGYDILNELKNTTVAVLMPPPEFSPHIESDQEILGDVFRADPHFKKAVEDLQDVVFYTNPFDILNCIDKSLTIIEQAATIYNDHKTMVFPFEVTFELFMAVAISSQVRNWENLSILVENFTPTSGLCPSFEFSKAKIVASVMQFQTMVAEMRGENTAEQAKKTSEFVTSISETFTDSRSGGIVMLPESEKKERLLSEEEEEEALEKNIDNIMSQVYNESEQVAKQENETNEQKIGNKEQTKQESEQTNQESEQHKLENETNEQRNENETNETNI